MVLFEWGLIISIVVACFFLSGICEGGWKTWLLTAVGLDAVTFAYPFVAPFFVDKMPKNPVEDSFTILFWVCVFFVVMAFFPTNARTTKSGKRDKRYTKKQKELDGSNVSFLCDTVCTSVLALGIPLAIGALVYFVGQIKW